MPANRVRREQVAEELRDYSQTVRFVAVNGVVVFGEHCFEEVLPQPVELAEPLADQAKEFIVCALLAAALDDHRR